MGDHTGIDLPLAPGWSVALGTAGKACILLGLVFFLIALVGSMVKRDVFRRWAGVSFTLGGLCLFATFVILGTLFVTDRFEFLYIYQRSDSVNPLKYKIASIWSGQQGSFLLWAVCAAIFGLWARRHSGPYRAAFTATYAAVLGTLCGILAYETPFTLQPLLEGKLYTPPNGAGMTPSLQNYWVVIHPPTIFLGFGSLTVLFALTVAAMVTGDKQDWAARARPWAILSTAITGLGLCMGGFWAYETLGWGGFWMWDPVENVSFVPWILTAVLLHGLIVQVTRKKWIGTNLMLGGLPFLSFVYGTFLTRAGFLDGASVHSFASMDRKAHLVLLIFLITSVVGFLGLWLARGLRNGPVADVPDGKGVRREGIYASSSVLLGGLALATGIGMSVPLLQYLAGKKPAVVEEHVYHLILGWFFIPIMLLMAAGPFVSWRRMCGKELFSRVVSSLSITMGLLGICLFVMKHPSLGISPDMSAKVEIFKGVQVSNFFWMSFLFGICLLAVVANLIRLFEVGKRSKMGVGGFLAHLGLAVAMAGLIFSRGFERRAEMFVQDGVPAQAMGYVVTYKSHTDDFMNRNNKMLFSVQGPDGSFEARPGLFYTVGNQGEVNPMVWPHIQRHPSHDVYFTLHPQVLEASEMVTFKPGETKDVKVDDFAAGRQITFKTKYVEMTREGEAGKTGAKFGAKLEFAGPNGKTTANPTMELAETGMRRNPDLVNDDLYVNVTNMNAADKSMTIQLGFIRPIYPVELFYKPLTVLVWTGTGLMTLGALIAAFARRFRRAELRPEETESKESATIEEDALVSTP